MDDYGDILNQFSNEAPDSNDNNDEKKDESTQDMNSVKETISLQQSLVSELRTKTNELTEKLKESTIENKLLQDQIAEMEKMKQNDNESDDVKSENIELKKQCSEWEEKYEEEHKENERLKETLEKLQEEHQIYRIQSLDYNQWNSWDSDDVFLFLMNINDGILKPYEESIRSFILDGQVKGRDLPSFNMNDWKDSGITVFGHRKAVVAAVKSLAQPGIVVEEGGD